MEVIESQCDDFLHNSFWFEWHLSTVQFKYILKILENDEWGGEPEIVAFFELYCVNIYFYEGMASFVF